MVRPVGEQIVVLTGASSGIGRETALEFGRRGATLVLAARNKEALDTLVAEVERLGGEAVAVPVDVGDFDQVTELAAQAVERFGRIDTWVNNASVSTYGTVEQMDVDEIRRVIEVNLLGEIHGMKAALPHLRRTGGTIINVSSTLGKRAVALQAAYCAAKHGVVAFGEALRLELRHAKVPVAVVDVLPSSINTPLFEHARSKLGVVPQPIPPVYEPRVVADAIA
jgi:NAD(P)-dependent dehydrogenase (short-subunit alcohol dehydrogenase family)